MKVIPLEESELSLAELVELARDEALVLTRAGEPVVTIRDASGSDWESAVLATDRRFQAIIERSRDSYRERGGISLGELRRELDLPRPGNAGHQPADR
ncbi:MAG: hypothetical protein WD066_07810 [Planctomycetaceae bacterium]